MNQLFKDHGKVHAHAFGMNASISTIAMLGCKTIDIVKGSFFLIHNTSMLILKYDQQNKEQLTDFPGGSMSDIIRSIKEKLMTLPDRTTVYPGHNDVTTIENERMYNPYL